jgi:hypothetical protein
MTDAGGAGDPVRLSRRIVRDVFLPDDAPFSFYGALCYNRVTLRPVKVMGRLQAKKPWRLRE